MLKLKNTLTKKLEKFQPLNDSEVLVYQCGPTVYKTQHIGNMRAVVMGDLIRRTLQYLGYEVKFVRNYTDVGHLTDDGDEGEDKMNKSAKEERRDPLAIADHYIKIYEEDVTALNTVPPTVKPRATEYIQEMISMVQTLVEKGFAYVTDNGVYFDTSKAKDYTRLSGQKIEFNQQGAGHAEVEDANKKYPSDFALWLFKTGKHKNALQTWPSPFGSSEVEQGQGFPGWHIECSAMSKAELADTIDIHIGGIEHVPVHHTNEIAQSECANGADFVNYWLHNEHLMVDNQKMSKSLGNVYYMSDIVDKGYDPLALRYFFLQAHYRSKQNFTWEALDAAAAAYTKLKDRVATLFGEVAEGWQPLEAGPDAKFSQEFMESLENDVNVPKALSVVWDLLKSDLESEQKLATILKFDQVLGLNLERVNNPHLQSDYIPAAAQKLIEERAAARSSKNWAKSDELRDELKQKFDLEVLDTPEGQKIQF